MYTSRHRIACSNFLLSTFLFQTFNPLITLATNGPTSPQSSSFAPAGDTEMVDLFSGDLQYNIDLLDIEGYPINLSYSSSNVGMEAPAAWVGFGWSLNPGSIKRGLNGVPDDFSGDIISTKTAMKDNEIFRVQFAPDGEFLGQSFLSLGSSVAVKYDNFRGIGFEYSTSIGSGVNISEFKGATEGPLSEGMKLNYGVGINYDSHSGAGLSYSLKLKGKEDRFTLGVSGGLNGYDGLSNISFDGGYKMNLGNHFRNRSVRNSLNKISNLSTGTTLLNTSFPTTSVGVSPEMEQLSVYLNFTTGINLLANDIQGQFAGNYFKNGIKDDGISELPAFGYFYVERGKVPKAKLDFSREKEGQISDEMKNLHLSKYDYDNYFVSGHGVSGNFRAHRTDFGVVGDPNSTSVSNSTSLGTELSVGEKFKLGVNVSVATGESKNERFNPFSSVGEFSYRPRDNENALYEHVYFRSMDEFHVNNTSTNFNSDISGSNFPNVLMNDYPIMLGNSSSGLNATIVDYSGAVTTGVNTYDYSNRAFNARNKLFIPITGEQRNVLNQTYDTLPASKYFFWNASLQEVQSANGLYNQSVVNGNRKSHHFSAIEVINEQGNRYVYGIPVYNKVSKSFTFNAGFIGNSESVGPQNNMVEYNPSGSTITESVADKSVDEFFQVETVPAYAESYLLTEVYSPDYIDRTQNGLTRDDFGSAYKFSYALVEEDYKWRAPYETNQASYEAGIENVRRDDRAFVKYGEKEIWYLSKIESKNFIALFVLASREDDKPVNGENGGINSSSNASKRLVRIELYNKYDFQLNGTSATPIKTVHFKYDYSLCPGVPDNTGTGLNLNNYYFNTTNHGGKLTLREVYFTYGKSGRSSDEGYKFEYNINNPSYSSGSTDHWGQFANGGSTAWKIFPYTSQNESDANEWASSWLLTRIMQPGGGSIEIEYEADRYRYVQDKESMILYNIIGSGTSAEIDDGVIGGDAPLYGAWPLNKVFNYMYFELPDGVSAPEDMNKYFQGISDLYYKFRVQLKNGQYEYVRGYAEIASWGLCTETGMVSERYGYVKLKNGDAGTIDLNNSHIISVAAWEFITNRALELVFPATFSTTASPIPDVLTQLADYIGQMQSMIIGPYVYLKNYGWAKEFDTESSKIRINWPHDKLGGGARVKRITKSDNWGTMTSGSSLNYVFEYDYVTENGESSGVASTEPGFAGEEIPFRMPVPDDPGKKMLAPNVPTFKEAPFGESLLPAPGVGYSRVVKRIVPDLGFANDINNQGIGTIVNEFYTAKDFPTVFKRTKLSLIINRMPTIPAFYIDIRTFRMFVTQGFTVKSNNMHGVAKAVWNYGQNLDKPLTGVEYKYKLDGPNNLDPLESFADGLSNRATTLIYGASSESTCGTDVDLVIDANKFVSETNINRPSVDMHFIGPPLFVLPSGSYAYSKTETEIQTASITKAIFQRGILDSVISYDQGARVISHQVAHDWKSGSALIVSETNEHNERFYNTSYPAHWAYVGKGFGYENVLARTKVSSFLGSGQYSCTLTDCPSDMSKIFYVGDEIIFAKGATKIHAWVAEVDNSVVRLVDKGGFWVNESLTGGATASITVIRPVRKNQFNDPILSILSEGKPDILNSSGDPDLYTNIISSQAVEYEIGGNYLCDREESSNRFLKGITGRWFPKRDWVYYTERDGTDFLGYFNSYSTFWQYNSSSKMYEMFPNEWTWRMLNYERSAWGNQISTLNALGRFSSMQYGYARSVAEMVVDNAKPNQILFESFDSRKYSRSSPFNYVDEDIKGCGVLIF